MFKSKNIKITDFTLKSKQPFFKAQSISGKFQRRFTGIHFYEAEFTANFMAQDINEVKEFVARHLFGRPFNVPLSYFSKYTGDVRQMVTAAAGTARGGRKVRISNFTGTLKAGTIVQFENHKKIYTITEDVKSGGGNSQPIEVNAPLNINGNVNSSDKMVMDAIKRHAKLVAQAVEDAQRRKM